MFVHNNVCAVFFETPFGFSAVSPAVEVLRFEQRWSGAADDALRSSGETSMCEVPERTVGNIFGRIPERVTFTIKTDS